jgi:hypothetical protein
LRPGTSQRAQGFIRPDGRPFANSVDDLTSGKIFYPPSVDENGTVHNGDVYVATGTGPDGTRGADAQMWTSATAAYLYGNASATTGQWTYQPSASIQGGAHLYCFGIDFATALSIEPQAGRTVFVSSGGFTPGGQTPDSFCQMEASAHGLTGNLYRALIATQTVAATDSSRFDLNGPTWVRLDGVPWLATAGDLKNGAPLTAPNVDSTGAYRKGTFVWTGSQIGTGTGGAATTCTDWSSTAMGQMAILGTAISSSPEFWNSSAGYSCSTPDVHLYCLEM